MSGYYCVVAIDPSSDITGIVQVQFDTKGQWIRCYTDALRSDCRKTGLTARFRRLHDIRGQVARFMSFHPLATDVVAYETPYNGRLAADVVHQSIGAYLTLSAFDGLPVVSVHPSTVRAVAGASRLKRAGAKLQTIAWANRTFSLSLSGSDGEAVADALAVAVAAFRAHVKASQQALALPSARKVASPTKKVGKA